VAEAQPQTAHAAVSRSLQFEWSCLQSVIPMSSVPLCSAIHNLFCPLLLVSDFESICFIILLVGVAWGHLILGVSWFGICFF